MMQYFANTGSRLLLRRGLSIEAIAEVLPSLSVDVIKQLKQQLPQA